MASQKVLLVVTVLLGLSGLTLSFRSLFEEGSYSRRDITETALLMKTAEIIVKLTKPDENDILTIDESLTVSKVQNFLSKIPRFSQIHYVNLKPTISSIGLTSAFHDKHHFNNEMFQEGRELITSGLSQVKQSINKSDFKRARQTLGRILQALQDFYSNSNWVELGNVVPFRDLISQDPLLNLTAPETPTCRSCRGGNCTDNLLPELKEHGLLTSGYYDPFFSDKPAGKCSHGGIYDRTSTQDPVGGISKDTVSSDHGHLHHQAAALAINATVELLEDIRADVGDKNFLRLVGLVPALTLSCVIDTTESMREDIAEAKRVLFDITDSKNNSTERPILYVLVPFNDPGYGPLTMTTDSGHFEDHIDMLAPHGGGDFPDLCLSGLQLALNSAPSFSEIFVFTDATAKDSHLRSTIMALIESTKSVVNFMMTGTLGSGRYRRDLEDALSTVSEEDIQLYRDISRASGGQAIQVTKAELSVVTTIISDSMSSAVVTIFQTERSPGGVEKYDFTVEGSLKNMIVYVTGAAGLFFTLSSPSGKAQNSSQTSGPLGSLSKAGNFHRLSLNPDYEAGQWTISIDSKTPYSIKVTGRSPVNFIFNLLEAPEDPSGDFGLKEGRPSAGGDITLLVSLTGSDTTKVTEVTLFDTSGPREVHGSLQSIGRGDFLVSFSRVPAGTYVVRLKGEDSSANFQRQAATQIKTSYISVKAQTNNTSIRPGSNISIPFTVTSTSRVVGDSAGGTFRVRANTDSNFNLTSPSTVNSDGTVTLTVPDDAEAGMDVTVTIEAEDSAATDSNYVVVRLSVVKGFTGPVLQMGKVTGVCPLSLALCSNHTWDISGVMRTDQKGRVDVIHRRGLGTLMLERQPIWGDQIISKFTYRVSCCHQIVDLAVVDRAGNVGMVMAQAKRDAPVNSGGWALSTFLCLWGNVLTALLLQ